MNRERAEDSKEENKIDLPTPGSHHSCLQQPGCVQVKTKSLEFKLSPGL